MLFFGKKKTAKLDLSWLHADMHSHLVPGIDDGAEDMETSLELVRGMQELGYKKLVTTPHILWDMYQNTPERILTGLAALRKSVAEAGIDIDIHAAAEYYLDEHFDEELANKAPLLPIGGNMILVEFSMVTAQLDLQQTLFDIQIQNYQPVIAHPERYIYLMHKKSYFDELKENGCLFQLNLLALTGYYGKTIMELAEYLIKKNYYDFAGTDLHNARHLAALQKLAGSKLLETLKDSGRLKNATL
jgi:protein-tyrosine phosphatase